MVYLACQHAIYMVVMWYDRVVYPPMNDSSGSTSQMFMHVVVTIKWKPKKISRSSFVCWDISRVNSFISFLWGSRGEDHDENVEVALICIIVELTRSPYYLVFSFELNACRFQLSPMLVHYYYCPHRSVVQVKSNNDDIWWTDWDEKSWYELDLSCFCKYD